MSENKAEEVYARARAMREAARAEEHAVANVEIPHQHGFDNSEDFRLWSALEDLRRHTLQFREARAKREALQEPGN